MSTIRDIATQARAALQEKFPKESLDVLHKEVSLLLAYSLGLSREQLITRSDETVSPQDRDRFDSLILRRMSAEPLAYIMGTTEFYSLEFSVGPDVLIPRKETEMIVDRALELFSAENFVRIIDIGCGSGAIILSIAHELRKRLADEEFAQLSFEAFDISPSACARTLSNSRSLKLSDVVRVQEANLLEKVEAISKGSASIFVSNPPYVPDDERLESSVVDFEPRLALRGGAEGLDIIADLFAQFKPVLDDSPRSLLLLEIGIDQWARVECLARENGIKLLGFHEDLQGIKRIAEVGSIERDSLYNRR